MGKKVENTQAANAPGLNIDSVSGSYCVRKHDLLALAFPKVAENLSKSEAENLKNKMQAKSIAECGCSVTIFFVSEI